MRISCFKIILCLFAFPAFANPLDALDASRINDKLPLTNHAYYIRTPADVPIDSVVEILKKNQFVNKFVKMNMGYNDSIYWLIVPIKNL